MHRYLSWGNEVRPMNEAYEEEMMAAYERCGLAGERVIGLAFKHEGDAGSGDWQSCVRVQCWQSLSFLVSQVAEDSFLTSTTHAEARNPHEWGEACKSGEVLQGFVFTGLISLVDPPKVGVMEAVLQVGMLGDRCLGW